MNPYQWETTPPINLRSVRHDIWTEFWIRIFHAERADRLPGESCVAYHKRKLGKQTYCWVGGSESRKYYIWETPLWRIFVHNVQGVDFEVPVKKPKPWEAVRDCAKLGLSVEP